MSYQFHITRADFWPESEQFAIEKEEWEAVADVHPELTPDGHFSWVDIGRQAAYTIANETISFSWRHGKVDISGIFTDKAMAVASDLASELRAAVVSDDD
ncbi:hypothetical protein ACWDRR_40560 [Kitasatospora sp. NPDC003701]